MRTTYHVDVPPTNPSWADWEHIASFESKEEAIAFVQKNYGADDEGKISLISEQEDDDDEE